MKAKNCLSIGLGIAMACGAATSVNADKPALQQAQWNGKVLTPVSIAKMYADGTHGEFVEVGFSQRGAATCPDNTLVFDAFEPDLASLDSNGNVDGTPIGADAPPCSTAFGAPVPSSRWYFGTTYNQFYYVNDFQAAPGFNNGIVTRQFFTINFLEDGNSNNSSQLLVFSSILDDFDSTCAGPANDVFVSGFIFNYGTVAHSTAGYYVLLATLCTDLDSVGGYLNDTQRVPGDGGGSHDLIFATDFFDTDSDGINDTITAPIASQSMLWGTSSNEPVDDGRPGTEGPIQWDDDGAGGVCAQDLMLCAPDECYDYTFGVCPDPLGFMYALLGDACNPDCADYNGDGSVNGIDVGAFLGDFAGGGIGGPPLADCNGDGVENGIDVGAFLGAYAACTM